MSGLAGVRYCAERSAGTSALDAIAETGDPQIVLAKFFREHEVTREAVAKDLKELLNNLAEKHSSASPIHWMVIATGKATLARALN